MILTHVKLIKEVKKHILVFFKVFMKYFIKKNTNLENI